MTSLPPTPVELVRERARLIEERAELEERIRLAPVDVDEQTAEELKAADARVRLLGENIAELDAAIRVVPAPDEADVKRVLDEAAQATEPNRILEVNGFAAIRQQALALIQSIANLPEEALDAALAFHDQAIGRLKLDPSREAAAALQIAEAQGDYMRLAKRCRAMLGELDEKLATRQALLESATAGAGYTGPPRNREERRKAERGRRAR